MKKLILSAALALVASGCATNTNPDTCKKAIAAYQLYQASLADGRVPSADEKRISAAAAAFLQLQCGWSPVAPATPASKALGTIKDQNGIPYLVVP
jgi:hypothetical protein